jgi:hypothetical protein
MRTVWSRFEGNEAAMERFMRRHSTRSSGGTMNKKAEAIRKANTIEDLYKHLEWIMGETERIIGSRKASFEEVHKMGDYLKDIRLLLNELNCREAWPAKSGAAGPSQQDLAARYLDLEGKVKELRNDLDREMNKKST